MKKIIFRISALSALVSFFAVAIMAGAESESFFENNGFIMMLWLGAFALSLVTMNRTFEG